MNIKLKQLIVNKLGVDYEDVLPETMLEEDLGLYGDDAMEFLVVFSKEFNVEISNFMAADYFSPEGDIILPSLIRAITGKKKKKQKYLQVQHLEKAILAGRLDEEIINS